ncbi:DUF2235 domain-containing protein [Paracoccus sp. 1_MG-2023]|uniref:DUF2235 domain-containing protein n=1 Tax=unclassified Paracoccus (in: a-proteobacteria) TaxID=2688777 RepID=UPI001C07FAAE|nr:MULTISPECIES: DUF2235 domain-containing protein [unclassified Paracoccus (in: a-proteobacteria)]MBU2956367.1 DUF2235 domain-containing protein [Paracoccus sp. C2R09]MDO6668043.1 DUF2235 domain-containing protein [Paracoccus sp. 1_MG-2023]
MNSIRPIKSHVVLMDGTFASLAQGRRSSIGRIHRLLGGELGLPRPTERMRVHYAIGQQWNRWRTIPELIMGTALEERIVEAYGWLATDWRPGDPIFMMGYSRGGFAVRSLAGMIARVGLLRPEFATPRNIRLAWRFYRRGGPQKAMELFRRRRCHPEAPIRMLGCFDAVMALGLRLPFLWMLTEPRFRFHDTHLGQGIAYGYQALALDETRLAFAPVLWDDDHAAGRIEQAWFRGSHPDIGGQLAGYEFARPLANIPLVWMLERAESHGLPLPNGWRALFPCDATAPSLGTWRRWGKLFLARGPRVAGRYATECLHPSLPRPYAGPGRLIGHLADKADVAGIETPPGQGLDPA